MFPLSCLHDNWNEPVQWQQPALVVSACQPRCRCNDLKLILMCVPSIVSLVGVLGLTVLHFVLITPNFVICLRGSLWPHVYINILRRGILHYIWIRICGLFVLPQAPMLDSAFWRLMVYNLTYSSFFSWKHRQPLESSLSMTKHGHCWVWNTYYIYCSR